MTIHNAETANAANTTRTSNPLILWPIDLDDLFGPPPLLVGEDPAAYQALLQAITQEVQPRGVIEQIYVRDYVYLTWEIMRYRRLKPGIMAGQEQRVVADLLKSKVDAEKAKQLAIGRAIGDPNARAEVSKILQEMGKSEFDLNAPVYLTLQDQIERLDGLTAMAEKRRILAYDEIFQHRAQLARELAAAASQIEHQTGPASSLPASDVQDGDFRELTEVATESQEPEAPQTPEAVQERKQGEKVSRWIKDGKGEHMIYIGPATPDKP